MKLWTKVARFLVFATPVMLFVSLCQSNTGD
jgi:hypothetical protein